AMVFPQLIEKPLNLRDLEQGLEQLNRLTTKRIDIDIEPGQKKGYSAIVLRTVTARWPVSAALAFDNSGQQTTGTGQSSLTFSVDNPLRLADRWQFSFSRNNDFRQQHGSQSFYGLFSLPY